MRELNEAGNVQAASDHARPFIAVELDFPQGKVRACSMDRNIVIAGNEYLGVGVLGEVGDLVEGSEIRSYGLTVSLAGIPLDFLQYLQSQDVQGREAIVLFGFLNDAYEVIESKIISVGRMDTQDITLGKLIRDTINIESIMVDWERARVRRYTDVDHQAEHPGDTFFKYIAAMENMTLRWGR